LSKTERLAQDRPVEPTTDQSPRIFDLPFTPFDKLRTGFDRLRAKATL
jgi:hypothetical protein